MNLNSTQIMGLAIVVVSVLSGGASQLTTLFGQVIANDIIALALLANGILGGFAMVLGRTPDQQTQVKTVLAMPGVERIDVNARASQELATMAVDPAINKIAPLPAATAAVTAIASKGP